MTSEERDSAKELVAQVEAFLAGQEQVDPDTEPWPRPRRPVRRARRPVRTVLQAIAVMLLAIAILIQLLWR